MLFREGFIINKKNYGKFHNWSDPPFSAKIMEKMMYFFWILDHYLSTLETFFFFTPKI